MFTRLNVDLNKYYRLNGTPLKYLNKCKRKKKNRKEWKDDTREREWEGVK